VNGRKKGLWIHSKKRTSISTSKARNSWGRSKKWGGGEGGSCSALREESKGKNLLKSGGKKAASLELGGSNSFAKQEGRHPAYLKEKQNKRKDGKGKGGIEPREIHITCVGKTSLQRICLEKGRGGEGYFHRTGIGQGKRVGGWRGGAVFMVRTEPVLKKRGGNEGLKLGLPASGNGDRDENSLQGSKKVGKK